MVQSIKIEVSVTAVTMGGRSTAGLTRGITILAFSTINILMITARVRYTDMVGLI